MLVAVTVETIERLDRGRPSPLTVSAAHRQVALFPVFGEEPGVEIWCGCGGSFFGDDLVEAVRCWGRHRHDEMRRWKP